jgi:hypothetical protein
MASSIVLRFSAAFAGPSAVARPFTLAVPLAFAMLAASAPAAQAQELPGSDAVTPDSVAERLGLPDGHAPKGALRRALMVPGWGQYYNRQYWKMPVVAAALGGVVYALVYSWDRYFLYRDAWRYRRTNGIFAPPPADGESDSYDGDFGGPAYREAYRTVARLVGSDPNAEAGLGEVVKQRRQQLRRWGEMAILGVGVFWILQVADAYVSAHLLGFELSAPSEEEGEESSAKNFSVQLAPTPGGGAAASVRLRF